MQSPQARLTGAVGSLPEVGPARLRTRRVLGFDFVSSRSLVPVAEAVLGPQDAQDGKLPIVLTPNVDYMVHLDAPKHAALTERLRQSRYVLPDGQPLVWTSRLTGGEPLAARLPGSSLLPLVWERIVAEQRRAVVVASCEETAQLIRRDLPDVGIVVPPYFDADDPMQLAEVAADVRTQIDKVEPEFVIIGISFPKQQRIALSIIDSWEGDPAGLPLFLTLGASFELHYGLHRRAPGWMQACGLEWFFRFLLEPRRLFRRYFVTDLKFLKIMAGEVLAARRHGPAR